MIKFLLEAGVSVEVVNDAGETPLHLVDTLKQHCFLDLFQAVSAGLEAVLPQLIAKMGNLDAQTKATAVFVCFACSLLAVGFVPRCGFVLLISL